MVECPDCTSQDIALARNLTDGRKELRCASCGNRWVRGEVSPAQSPPPRSLQERVAATRGRFPKRDAVDPETAQRVATMAHKFVQEHPRPRPKAYEFRAEYSEIFTRKGLKRARPEDLHLFANLPYMARPGNMSVFNQAWNEVGPKEGARRVVEAIEYLLYGPDAQPLEHRLTALIEEDTLGMKGFKESLLTKVLCVAYPERFLPILKYTGRAGKAEIAAAVYGLRLPSPAREHWRLGYLITWSNDLLVDLVTPYFDDLITAAAFLWEAKDLGSRGALGVNSDTSNMIERELP